MNVVEKKTQETTTYLYIAQNQDFAVNVAPSVYTSRHFHLSDVLHLR